MESLPDEVLLKVFKYLNMQTVHRVIARISPRWEKLSWDRSLNRHIELKCEEDFNFLEKFPKKESVISITVNDFLEISDMVQRILYLISFFPHLNHISTGHPLCDDSITSLVGLCPMLKSMDIIPIDGYTEVYLDAIRCLEIIVSYCHTDSAVVHWIANNCLFLTQMHFYVFADSIPSRYMQALLHTRGKHLTKLTLKNPPKETYATIAVCTNLKSLILHKCRYLFADGLLALLALKQLSVLCITAVNKVEKCHFDKFVEGLELSRLIALNLSGTPFCDLNAMYLADKKPPLRWLQLIRCENLRSDVELYLRSELKFLVAKTRDEQDLASDVFYGEISEVSPQHC